MRLALVISLSSCVSVFLLVGCPNPGERGELLAPSANPKPDKPHRPSRSPSTSLGSPSPSSPRAPLLAVETRSESDHRVGYSWSERDGEIVACGLRYTEVSYSPRRLWRLAPDETRWVRVELESPTQPTRLSRTTCSLLSLAGEKRLPIGLYYVAADVDGAIERRKLYCGPILCNDLGRRGPAPEGMVVDCVPFSDHAAVMIIPDPSLLRLD